MLAADKSIAPLRTRLAGNPVLRNLALPLLRRCDFEITVRNSASQMPLRLLSYTHKGYWYYGAAREAATLRRFADLICPGNTVIEAGGHIGYVTQYLSRLVGPAGQVHVFEPGKQNTAFLRGNLAACKNVNHIGAAVADQTGSATFYEENIGGFMNSLDPDFARSSDQGKARKNHLRIKGHTVPVVRLDDYANDLKRPPAFLKIDVEGAELAVLRGAQGLLGSVRALMVEVTRDRSEVFELLMDQKFELRTTEDTRITTPSALNGNVFAVNKALST